MEKNIKHLDIYELCKQNEVKMTSQRKTIAEVINNSKDHRLSTRDVYLNPVFSFLYWHMEYHIEHHMFPMVPSYNLKKLHKLIKDQLPPTKKNLWDAYKEIIPAIIKQAQNPDYKIDVRLPNSRAT